MGTFRRIKLIYLWKWITCWHINRGRLNTLMQKQSAPNSVYLNSLQKWIRAVTEARGRQARVQPPPCSPCSPPAARQGLPAHAKRWGRRGGRKQASAPSLLLELTAPISGHWVPGRVVWGLSGPPPTSAYRALARLMSPQTYLWKSSFLHPLQLFQELKSWQGQRKVQLPD